MADWQELVRQRLSGLALDPTERDEVCAELAAHLEDTREALLQEGLTEEGAVCGTLAQVTDWNDLQRKIQLARKEENTMTDRVTQFWFPGLLTFAFSMGVLSLVQKFGPAPLVLRLDHPPVVMFYTLWVATLPLVGAMGAYLSFRAGGSRRVVRSSIIFPVLPFLVFLLMAFPVSLAIERFVAHNVMATGLLMALIGWVLVPAIALLAGGLPVQVYFSRRLTQRSIPSH